MLPSLVVKPPMGERWIHEIKHDGYRTILVIDGGQARAFTRNRNDWTSTYPAIVAAAAKLRCKSAIIDGEVICPGEDGRSDFHGIRSAIGARGRGLVFIAFDLLFLDGKDLRDRPLEERRRLLRGIIPRSPKSLLQFSDDVAGEAAEIFAAAEAMGLEGIVSKRLGSPYRSGRADTWRKTKCVTEEEMILVGTKLDSRTGSPMALLARREGDELIYAGSAGFVMPEAERDRLRTRTEELRVARPAIRELAAKRDARWLKPELTVRVRHLKGEGLRHAVVKGIADDR